MWPCSLMCIAQPTQTEVHGLTAWWILRILSLLLVPACACRNILLWADVWGGMFQCARHPVLGSYSGGRELHRCLHLETHYMVEVRLHFELRLGPSLSYLHLPLLTACPFSPSVSSLALIHLLTACLLFLTSFPISPLSAGIEVQPQGQTVVELKHCKFWSVLLECFAHSGFSCSPVPQQLRLPLAPYSQLLSPALPRIELLPLAIAPYSGI